MSTLDRGSAESPGQPRAALWRRAGGQRRRALVGCAVLVLALHILFIGNVAGVVTGSTEMPGASMSIRTLPGEPAMEATAAPATERPDDAAPVVTPLPAPAQSPPQVRERAPAAAAIDLSSFRKEASANSNGHRPMLAAAVRPAEPASSIASSTANAASLAAATPQAEVGEALVAGESGVAAGGLEPALAAGDEPPPLYRTELPPPVSLHYQVQRGPLRGTGVIRWQSSGDRYRLVLEAQAAGIALLKQTSEGGIDANGVAPLRFLDQRARRSAVAANFRRDEGRITFSGTRAEWPLLPGSQDRLSWMIQLAGVAAAAPERLVEGARITMVVVGARGDASAWTFRCAGPETLATVSGTVHAIKLVRAARSAYDTSAEIWLDPERSYLPARATLRNSTGASEYDLLLERVDRE
ncbi:MAG TPA: DUF3108 domain-containing protein [Caldimonas sp.]|nr:DUF3108 domain-containing protein [Caldimonas sp.]